LTPAYFPDAGFGQERIVMGKQIDHDHRYTEDEKEYLRSRGRGYLIAVNERKYGTEDDPTDTPEGPQESITYDDANRQKAVYDVGGAPLPGTTLDHNTGRVMDRDNGQLLEYTGPGHTPGAYDLRGRREPEGFDSRSDAGDDIDEDIVEEVLGISNKEEVKKRLKKEKVEFSSDDDRDTLNERLAIALQDKRDAAREEEAAQPGPR
jgi:hypothetical protein